jgi:Protein of unknown function (DUF1592)/Protein of unknown function (DUF1588)/Protein of unknown function (DUF1587)/Protein of unknown function (DUF1585)/Protein of unknown function (DUF1595)
MIRTRALGAIGAALAGTILLPGATMPTDTSASAAATANHATFDQQSFWRTTKLYCDTCHFGPRAQAKLNLQALDLAHLDVNGEAWEKVLRKLRNREMPPLGAPRPDAATYDALVATIEAERDRVGQVRPNPGRPTLHRLNRTEYANVIRDLVAVEADVAELLPADDAGYGFDNIGDVLSVSPVLMESYLSAARKISRSAIGNRASEPVVANYELPRFLIQNDRMSEDLPLGSRGGLAVRHDFPLDAEYVLRIKLQKNGYTYTLGTEHARQIDVRVDGQKIKQFTVGGDYKGKRPAQPSSFGQGEYERYLINVDQNLELRFPAKAGTHLIQVMFRNHTVEPEGIFQPPITDYSYALSYGRSDMEPAIASLTIGGPYDAKSTGDTPSRAQVFICKPASAGDEEACARRILSNLAHRAFRRPVADADLQDLMGFYETGRRAGNFDDGIEFALQRILVDPEFLFRVERDPPQVAAGTAYRISDLELASRLSFFLWSSIPDNQLLDLAEHDKLSDPATLEQQVRRMLADPRSAALVSNFAGQWLYLRNLEKTWPNPDVFPEFDGNLRDAFQKESELFFQSMISEDRSVLDLINADYTFVNERLARHYQIPNVYGSHFRRIALTDENRRGFLGQGSMLMVTSYATRTAPTIRGKWLLENILGTPPPPPPPNVPDLALKTGADGNLLTMRQQMEAHRSNPACASCHKVMDPLGFALENFDATGKWRSTDGGSKIDASGVTPDGFPLNGPSDLRNYLMSRPDQFVTTVTEKLLTYALGRGVEEYDHPVIRRIVRDTAPGNYKWSDLVIAIAESTPFQMRKSREP